MSGRQQANALAFREIQAVCAGAESLEVVFLCIKK